MTRRGTLAYYAAAIVVGCFFTSVAFSFFGTLPQFHGGPAHPSGLKDFFLIYFLALLAGAAPAALFGLLLRRMASLLRIHSGLAWAALGAVLGSALILTLGSLAEAAPSLGAAASGPVTSLATKLFSLGMPVMLGPLMLRPIWWVMIPAGALTALVLRAVHRAFEPRPDAGPESGR